MRTDTAGWDKAAGLRLYCSVGFRSYLSYRILVQLGFTDVATLFGGSETIRTWHEVEPLAIGPVEPETSYAEATDTLNAARLAAHVANGTGPKALALAGAASSVACCLVGVRRSGLLCPGGWRVRAGFLVLGGVSGSCVNIPGGVVNRCVDYIEIHGAITGVGDVMPGARGHQDAPTVRHDLLESEIVLVWPHLCPADASIEAQELVGIGVHFQSDRFSGRNAHQGDLQIPTGPGYRSIVGVLRGGSFQIKGVRAGADVTVSHGG